LCRALVLLEHLRQGRAPPPWRGDDHDWQAGRVGHRLDALAQPLGLRHGKVLEPALEVPTAALVASARRHDDALVYHLEDP
jgi:hypothetical protein